jgi:acyl carrier protein
MLEHDDRLVRCFSSVFPILTPDEVRVASAGSLEVWDSLAAVTLVALVEQEFDLTIDLLDLPDLSSFEAFRKYIDQHRSAGAGAGKEIDRSL